MTLGLGGGGVVVPRTINSIGRRHVEALGDFAVTHIRLLDGGAFGDLAWVETRPLQRGRQAFEQLVQGFMGTRKVILVPE